MKHLHRIGLVLATMCLSCILGGSLISRTHAAGGGQLDDIIVLENTPEVQHMVVCTLCSCYPTQLLGPPPDWYKSFSYRSRAVTEPRAVMSEFGLELGEETEVRVVDSNSELRFLVIPRRPGGTDGWSEEQLATLVNRNSMIGVAAATEPGTD